MVQEPPASGAASEVPSLLMRPPPPRTPLPQAFVREIAAICRTVAPTDAPTVHASRPSTTKVPMAGCGSRCNDPTKDVAVPHPLTPTRP